MGLGVKSDVKKVQSISEFWQSLRSLPCWVAYRYLDTPLRKDPVQERPLTRSGPRCLSGHALYSSYVFLLTFLDAKNGMDSGCYARVHRTLLMVEDLPEVVDAAGERSSLWQRGEGQQGPILVVLTEIGK